MKGIEASRKAAIRWPFTRVGSKARDVLRLDMHFKIFIIFHIISFPFSYDLLPNGGLSFLKGMLKLNNTAPFFVNYNGNIMSNFQFLVYFFNLYNFIRFLLTLFLQVTSNIISQLPTRPHYLTEKRFPTICQNFVRKFQIVLLKQCLHDQAEVTESFLSAIGCIPK